MIDSDSKAQTRTLHVLLAEDSAWMTDSLVEMLRSGPVQTDIQVVDSERDAVQLATQQALDLVILDLRLKQGNGFNVLKRLRTNQVTTPVVILSNYALPKYRQLASLLGAHAFLDKATEVQKLNSILESLSPDPQMCIPTESRYQEPAAANINASIIPNPPIPGVRHLNDSRS